MRELVEVVSEARSVVKDGFRKTERLQLIAMCLLAVGLAFLLLPATTLPWLSPNSHCVVSYSLLGLLGALGLAMVAAGALLYVLFANQLKALRGTEASMKLATVNLQEREGGCLQELGDDDEVGILSASTPPPQPHGDSRSQPPTPVACEE